MVDLMRITEGSKTTPVSKTLVYNRALHLEPDCFPKTILKVGLLKLNTVSSDRGLAPAEPSCLINGTSDVFLLFPYTCSL